MAVLMKLRAHEAVEAELEAIDAAVEEEGMLSQVGWCDILCPSLRIRRMLLVGLGIAFFQQVSGSEAIVYYTPTILERFGWVTEEEQNLAAIGVGAAKFLGACCGAL